MAQEVATKLPAELPKTAARSDAEAELSKTLGNFLRGYTPSGTSNDEPDTVARRYKIDFNTPLPDFNSKAAVAYAATDLDEAGKEYMALICDADTIQRSNIITPLINSPHPNIITMVASGVTSLTRLQGERFVVVYEKPRGAKLSALIAASKTRPSFEFICQYIISPLALAIKHLSEIGIAHSNINCDNIYFDTKSNIGAVVGQCVAEPSGYAQPFYYEPVERMQAMPAGKGEGDSTQDYYALAVVILHVIYGMNHFNGLTRDTLVKQILKEGAFNALTRQKDMPEIFYDFFRGLLSHNAYDRWSYRYLKAWLDGKRYNVMPTPPSHEAIRPFEFADGQAYTRREVANLFACNWSEAPTAFASGQLSTWVANSLRNKELNEYLLRTAKVITVNSKNSDPSVNEHIMRTITVFDPVGPVRLGNLSFHLDGINSLFADLIIKKSDDDLRQLMQFIEMSMFHSIAEQKNKEAKREDVENNSLGPILTKLDRIRSITRNTGLGFGVERIFYDLNPGVRCISPKLTGMHISSLNSMLRTLDRLAPRLSADSDPIDRHIAAFLASQLNILHETHLTSLSAQPTLATNQAVIALKMLGTAQQKSGISYLPGLTSWLALRILPLLDVIRSHTLKRKLVTMLGNAARSGNIQKMAELIIESGYAQAEATAYNQAVRNFKQNANDIVYYTKKEMIEIHSRMLGTKMAHYLAMFALFYSFVIAIRGS